MTKPKKAPLSSSVISSPVGEDASHHLRLALLWCEKCELDEAKSAYERALKAAKESDDVYSLMEALSGLLRLAGEAHDVAEIERIEIKLSEFMNVAADKVPAQVWYCKGVIAHYHENYRLGQLYFHKYLKLLREQRPDDGLSMARAWVSIANSLRGQGKIKRARFLGEKMHAHLCERPELKGIAPALYILLGHIHEKSGDLKTATAWYQKAHGAALSERNWYQYLYVLLAYARVCRAQGHDRQAHSYLDLVEKVIERGNFGIVKRSVDREREWLEKNNVDLIIDAKQAAIKMKDGAQVSLKKQYVLLDILEALSDAHLGSEDESKKGLSKAEIIERVWKETYRPEMHDNKLYYNINRLRKLIEKDTRNPQYLINWKEGYRLAPGLRVDVRK